MISMNVADGRLQAGMVGLIKSGKSTTLNALMKTQILPEAMQPETAAEVRIIHSTRKNTETVCSWEAKTLKLHLAVKIFIVGRENTKRWLERVKVAI